MWHKTADEIVAKVRRGRATLAKSIRDAGHGDFDSDSVPSVLTSPSTQR